MNKVLKIKKKKKFEKCFNDMLNLDKKQTPFVELFAFKVYIKTQPKNDMCIKADTMHIANTINVKFLLALFKFFLLDSTTLRALSELFDFLKLCFMLTRFLSNETETKFKTTSRTKLTTSRIK